VTLSKLALTNDWFAAQLSEPELLTKVWQTPLVQNEDLALVGTAVVAVVGAAVGQVIVGTLEVPEYTPLCWLVTVTPHWLVILVSAVPKLAVLVPVTCVPEQQPVYQ
jgi:hypothetical protein